MTLLLTTLAGDTIGVTQILEDIQKNSENLTHKTVRAYGRILLALLPELPVDERYFSRLKILLAAISQRGIPHYDRQIAAAEAIKLLEQNQEYKAKKSLSLSPENF